MAGVRIVRSRLTSLLRRARLRDRGLHTDQWQWNRAIAPASVGFPRHPKECAMKWFATSALSCAVAGLAMSAAFAQNAGHDISSMPGMEGMHAQEIPDAVARAVQD